VNDDRKTFLDFLEALFERRWDDAARSLADDAVWNLPPSLGLPTLSGRDDVVAFLSSAPDTVYQPGTLRLEPIQTCVENGNAACFAKVRATTKRGKPYENVYGFFARIRDGRIVEVYELLDTASFREQIA
jgi:ketosteroid isomerase-like protein